MARGVGVDLVPFMVHVPVRPSSGVIGWYGAVIVTATAVLKVASTVSPAIVIMSPVRKLWRAEVTFVARPAVPSRDVKLMGAVCAGTV